MIRSEKKGTIREIMLYCPICQTHTKHVRAGNDLVCGCGNSVAYRQSDKKLLEESESHRYQMRNEDGLT